MLCLKYLGLINFKEIKFMKIDILSDLHLDFYFKPHLTIEEKGPFRILCQLGKIENTKGHKYENRNRCRAIC